jgi:hypothetical protein
VSERLQPNGNPITIEGIKIQTPGLSGRVDAYLPGEAGARAASGWTDALAEAFEGQHVETQLILELSDTYEEPDAAPAGTRATHYDEAAMVLEVPDPGVEWGQILVYTDESGVTTWSYPRDDAGDLDTTRGGAIRTYVIPRAVAPDTDAGTGRGAFGAIAKKIIGIVVFPLLDPVFGLVGEFFARRWEEAKRPYRFRSFTEANHGSPDADPPDWDLLGSGRSLLMVHGTFSRAHAGFGGFSESFVGDLHDIYGGRVFAFDHFTLCDDPRDNVAWFVEHLPQGINLDLDIICHSRGGLVSRVLAERIDEFDLGDRRIEVDKVIFGAAPNNGTILTNAKYMGDFVDSYTNLINFVPTNFVTDALDAVITVAKLVSTGVLNGLDGLQSMRPEGDFLAGLNTGTDERGRYFALSSDFEPTNAGWQRYAADRLMDKIFKEPNDLVVPAASPYQGNGSDRFPITARLEFGAEAGVDHSGYFANTAARKKMLGWLTL